MRSSGPGGQNVNKVNSKAVLRWNVAASPSLPADVRERFLAIHRSRLTGEGELIVTSQRYRDQGRNVADALEKLRAMLDRGRRRPKTRRPTKPSAARSPGGSSQSKPARAPSKCGASPATSDGLSAAC